MPAEDAHMTRMIQREISRRYIDSTRMDIKAVHGTVYLRGQVRKLRGHNVDLEKEMDIIARTLRSKPGIRDVIVEVSLIG